MYTPHVFVNWMPFKYIYNQNYNPKNKKEGKTIYIFPRKMYI